MSEINDISQSTELHPKLEVGLRLNSRTFYLPVMKLRGNLQTAVASAYLCFRAIDEIEDHQELMPDVKHDLLMKLAVILTGSKLSRDEAVNELFQQYTSVLSQVTLDFNFWLNSIPPSVEPRVLAEVSAISARMGHWAKRRWRINDESELDQYAFAVAGSVGLLLNDLFSWYTNTNVDYRLAVNFGQGLQAVNILLNQFTDIKHGRELFPDGWGKDKMHSYALAKLEDGNRYIDSISNKMIREAFGIPLKLAFASLKVFMDQGRKLTRDEVLSIYSRCLAKGR